MDYTIVGCFSRIQLTAELKYFVLKWQSKELFLQDNGGGMRWGRFVGETREKKFAWRNNPEAWHNLANTPTHDRSDYTTRPTPPPSSPTIASEKEKNELPPSRQQGRSPREADQVVVCRHQDLCRCRWTG